MFGKQSFGNFHRATARIVLKKRLERPSHLLAPGITENNRTLRHLAPVGIAERMEHLNVQTEGAGAPRNPGRVHCRDTRIPARPTRSPVHDRGCYFPCEVIK